MNPFIGQLTQLRAHEERDDRLIAAFDSGQGASEWRQVDDKKINPLEPTPFRTTHIVRAATPGKFVRPDRTGTSYGFRDAWAAGLTPGYTVVIWTGRRDSTPLPGATGREAATPLLFKIFALLLGEHLTPEPRDNSPQTWHLRCATNTKVFRIMFAPSNVELAYDPRAHIDIRAAGGAPPYHWMIDGLPGSAGRELWTPTAPGFAHLTVIDSKGQSASEDVQPVGD